jgi:hypothetical protein
MRQLAEYTIDRLAQMEPYRQCGYVANPFLQYLLDSAISSFYNPASTNITTDTTPSKTNNKPD